MERLPSLLAAVFAATLCLLGTAVSPVQAGVVEVTIGIGGAVLALDEGTGDEDDKADRDEEDDDKGGDPAPSASPVPPVGDKDKTKDDDDEDKDETDDAEDETDDAEDEADGVEDEDEVEDDKKDKKDAPGSAPVPVPAAPLAPASAPVLAKSVTLKPVAGAVTVRLPGADAAVPLEDAASVPVGAIVDATAGSVALTSAHDANGKAQVATFRGAAFSVSQSQAKRPVTVLTLEGGDFAACGSAARARGSVAVASASGGKRAVRSLWGDGKGRFRTKGRHSSATVRGTAWRTTDRCDGTLTKVKHGVVAVRDFKAKRTVVLRKGDSHLARR